MKDTKVYSLLKFMDDELIKLGRPMHQVRFDFSFPEETEYLSGAHEHKCGDDFIKFVSTTGCSESEAIDIIRRCNSYEFIKGTQLSTIFLTEKGRAFINEHSIKPNQTVINAYGNTQIGDHNTQNITIDQAIDCLIKTIDAIHAPVAEKEEAKNRLQKFVEHPIIAQLISAGLISALKINPAL